MTDGNNLTKIKKGFKRNRTVHSNRKIFEKICTRDGKVIKRKSKYNVPNINSPFQKPMIIHHLGNLILNQFRKGNTTVWKFYDFSIILILCVKSIFGILEKL